MPRIFLMRHGESEANRQQRIVSDPTNGLSGFGLTERGRSQVGDSLRRWQVHLKGVRRVVASDFLRTRQTAGIAAEQLGVPVELDARLRERGFGALELGSSQRYHEVWSADVADLSQVAGGDPGGAGDPGGNHGAETVASVARRMLSLVFHLAPTEAPVEPEATSSPPTGTELRRSSQADDVLIVSHGDPLQILAAVCQGKLAAEHRSLPALEVAEIRRLEWPVPELSIPRKGLFR